MFKQTIEPQYLPCQVSVPNGNINPVATDLIEIIQQAKKKKKLQIQPAKKKKSK
jgi:hypothetical protein